MLDLARRPISVFLLILLGTGAVADVRVMPGYPNVPNDHPSERRPCRPGAPVLLWGDANGGDGTAVGHSYQWSLEHTSQVEVLTDGDLSGTVTDDAFIFEQVSFQLVGGTTKEVVRATLTVEGPDDSSSRYVELIVVGTNDPSSSTELDALTIDTRIAILDGLRHLHLQQEASGRWRSAGTPHLGSIIPNHEVATTSFVLWAFQNQGHLATNDPQEDIYSTTVRQGLDWLFSSAVSGGTAAPRATEALGARMDGVSDMNNNQRSVAFISGEPRPGYTNGIAASAVIASQCPECIVETGPFEGETYRTLVEDAVDWLGATQSAGGNVETGGSWSGRGGWEYTPSSSDSVSDMSINSWAYVAMEGAEVSLFDVRVPDWIKREVEIGLYYHQFNDPNGAPRLFGYRGTGTCCGSTSGFATTGGGLAGLSLAETAGPFHTPGEFLVTRPGPLNSITAKRNSALAWLGQSWHVDSDGHYGRGNRRNLYAMWTVARSLRITASSLGMEKVLLQRADGTLFDWETGALPGSTNVPDAGTPIEGYFPWLVRTQSMDDNPISRGRWALGTHYGALLETTFAVLILTPTVFLDPCDLIGVPALVGIEPADGESFPAGTSFLLSGQGIGVDPTRPVVEVLVNGEPSEAMDVSGRFFKRVDLAPGPNAFEITAIDSCGETTSTVVLEGQVPGQVDFQNLTDVSFSVAPQYQNTTFNHATSTLHFDVLVCNTGEAPVIGPVLMVFDNFSYPTITLSNPDGFLPEGQPYLAVTDPGEYEELSAAGCTTSRHLALHNPDLRPLGFDIRWLAPTNRPPAFISVPITSTQIGRAYRYHAEAVDPDGHELTYQLVAGPEDMTVNATDGSIEWSVSGDGGTSHSVILRAVDGYGGTAEQSYTLLVTDEVPNRPPYFTSPPLTQVSVAAEYVYSAMASDPDQDDLLFTILLGPDELELSPDGVLSWPLALPGEHPVSIAVDDGRGGMAQQTWTLSVGEATQDPHGPVLYGTPPTLAVVGRAFVYQPIAQDPDEDDVLTFYLDAAPPGVGLNAETGRISWVPGASQVGEHQISLRVSDSSGASAGQQWQVSVVLEAGNVPPYFSSVPPLLAVVGQAYEYTALAIDPESDDVSYELIEAPPGMAVDPEGSVLQWTPTVVGPFLVVLRATDQELAYATQVFTLTVQQSNTPPQITSTPSTQATVGGTYYYHTLASDPDGDPLDYSLTEGPAGMSIHPQTGLVSWRPLSGQIGAHAVEVRAADPLGAYALQTYEVVVAEDSTSPSVAITAEPDPVRVGQSLQVCVSAHDNVGVVHRAATMDGAPLMLDDFGCVYVVPSAVGQRTFEASATDGAGNTGNATRTLTVLPQGGGGTGNSVVEILSPPFGTELRTRTEFHARVDGPADESVEWELAVEHLESGQRVIIATGDEDVDGGVGFVDPSTMPNGPIRVLLTARTSTSEVLVWGPYFVSTPHKPGHYEVSFVDMQVPTGGIPISVGRKYSSLDVGRVGDFGPGWNLDYPGRVIDFAEEGSGETLRVGERVYVDDPSGQRTSFAVGFTPSSWLFPYLGTIRFDPLPGAYGQLSSLDVSGVFFDGTNLWQFFGTGAVNPDLYRLRTVDGYQFDIHEQQGLQSLADRNGNQLLFGPDGISSSTGTAVAFERDSQGRIVRIIGPDAEAGDDVPAPEVTYVYSSETGDLVSFLDELGNEVRYLYEERPQARRRQMFGQPNEPLDEPDHLLRQIVDPLERPFVFNEFDETGRLVAQIDSEGNRTEFQFDPSSNVMLLRDRLGNSAVEEFDESGFLVRRVDFDGAETLFENDEAGRVTRMTDCLGRVTQRSYDQHGLLASETDCTGSTRTTLRDGNGNTVEETDFQGNRWTYDYDGNGNLTRQVAPDGGETLYTYDAHGRQTSLTDPLGFVEIYDYDSGGLMTARTDRDGAVTEFEYDQANRRVLERRFAEDGSGGSVPVETRFEYDLKGRIVAVIDPLGYQSLTEYDSLGQIVATVAKDGTRLELSYDSRGNQVEVRHPDGTSRLMSYDLESRLASITDRDGRETRYERDGAGRVTKVLYPDLTPGDWSDNPARVTRRDCVGRPIAQIDERNHETQIAYECLDRSRAVTDPEGGVSTTFFNGNGQPITERDPAGDEVHYYYDGLGRRFMTRYSDGTEERSVHDKAGNKILVTLRDGHERHLEYDPAGRLTRVREQVGAAENVVEFEYDSLGALKVQRDALGREVVYTNDALSRPVAVTLPLGQSRSVELDALGRVTTETGFDGVVVEFEYDSDGRLVERQVMGGPSTAFEYTAEGLRTSAGPTSFEYGPRGRLRRVEQPDGAAVETDYDPAGNVISRTTVVSGVQRSTNYTYDGAGRLVSVVDPDLGTYQIERDTAGRVTAMTYPSGVREERSHDDEGRITAIVQRSSSGADLARFQYELDALGRIESVEETVGSDQRVLHFAYDAVGRVSAESTYMGGLLTSEVAFRYDAVGNRIELESTVGGVHRLTAYSYDDNDSLTEAVETGDGLSAPQVSTYEYDASGRMTVRLDPVGTTTFAYGPLGDLDRVVLPDGSFVDYFYDADRNRIAIQESGGPLRRLLLDRTREVSMQVAEYGLAGPSYWVLGERFLGEVSTASSVELLTDRLGSIRGRVSPDETLAATTHYSTFGVPNTVMGRSPQFAGEFFEPGIGGYHLRARDYDPTTGRFFRRDDFGGFTELPISLNRFVYANGDPINLTDPTGFSPLIGRALIQRFTQTIAVCGSIAAYADFAHAGIFGTTLLFGLARMYANPAEYGDNVRWGGVFWRWEAPGWYVSKAEIRGHYRGAEGRIAQFAFETPRGVKVRLTYKLDKRELSVSGGFNRTILDGKRCGVPWFKLDLYVRGGASSPDSVNPDFEPVGGWGFDITIAGAFKLQLPVFGGADE